MSLSAKREYLAKIHGRYQRAGRPHKSRILDEFCANCGYHRKAALRLLHRPLANGRAKRPGPKRTYEPAQVLPVLKAVWLASEQLCSFGACLPVRQCDLRCGAACCGASQCQALPCGADGGT